MGILPGTGLQAIGISFRQRTWLYFVRAMRLGVKSSLNVLNSLIIPEISKNPSIQAMLWILLVPFSQVCREDQVWKAEPKVGKTGMLVRKDCVPAPFSSECKHGYDCWGPLWARASLEASQESIQPWTRSILSFPFILRLLVSLMEPLLCALHLQFADSCCGWLKN